MKKYHQMQMAKNIAVLRQKSSKKQQAHLLCVSLVNMLKKAKDGKS